MGCMAVLSMGVGTKKGESILKFALAYDLIVVNTLFRKRFSHLVTFSSGQHCSQNRFHPRKTRG
jgi:hypothetical protein